MFIEQDNDIKFLKEYFLGVSFPTLLDIAYTDDGILSAMKSPNEKARLLADVKPPTNPKIQVLSDAEFTALEPEAFDCVVSRNALHFEQDLNAFFTESAKLATSGGTLIISDTVTDIEDAYLNSFKFKLDKKHVRFYTVTEVTAPAAAHGFVLQFFKRVPMSISLKQNPEYTEFIKGLPDKVLNRLAVVKDSSDELVGFSLQKGIFILNKI